MDRLSALLLSLETAERYERQQEASYVEQLKLAGEMRNHHNQRAGRYADAVKALAALIRDCYTVEGQK